jgi:hypothetical protein
MEQSRHYSMFNLYVVNAKGTLIDRDLAAINVVADVARRLRFWD